MDSMKRNRKTLEHELKALIIDIIRRPQLSDLASELNALGFSVTPALAESFKAIVVRMATASASETPLAGLLLDLLESPFPSGALVNLLRYIDKTGAPDTFLNIVAGGKPVREILSTVFGTSQYMSDIIIRNPGYLYWLIEKQTWERRETRASYLEDLKCDVANFQTVASKLDAARRFQRRMLLKIGVQDLLGQQTIEETTSSLSHLADAIAENVLDVLWQNLPGAEVDTAPGLAVLALGKLGGGELNYSSDVDLIYLCEDTSDDKLVLYKDVAKRFTTVLSEVTAEGYLYRVDLRLRPDGDVGPLVNPFTSMMLYYENRARPWEFQAMLKARVIAGDCSVGKRFLGAISALMFNPTLSYSPVETIALMRNRIRQNMSLRDRSFNIKLMEGGIRDVEFIVQTLQLVHGHDYPELLVANTIDGVKAAHKRKLLKRIEKQTLLNAYRFFRLVEHRLQMMHQLKTHSIPESQEEIALLAARVSRGPMGTYSHHKFLSTLTKHLTKIRLVSDSFFGGVCISESTLLLLRPEDAALTRKTLSKFGLSDTAHALSTIQSLAHGSFPHLIDRGTRESFLRLLPLLLEELARTADPNRALLNFSKIAGATSNALTLYSMLLESRPLRALIRDMVGASPLLTGK
ncbi:MAG: hypothetical protein OEN01_02855, partial [Candidatus Krumholzibacteria bacterium]|nr:hypothetical protein [Candidatus Krumholzibacteria bacterium]